ncbi:hypothetical protein Tco_0999694, partial [Tanacetum coccineum]
GVETKVTKIETPPLDQTEGRKEGNRVKMLSHLEIQGQRKRSLQAPLKMPPNLNISLPASLPMQRSQFKKPERPPTPDPDWSKRQQIDFRPPQTWISQVVRAEEPPISFDELNDTSFDFYAFVMNRLKILNLTQEVPLDYFINKDLEYLKGEDLSRRYSTSVTKTKAVTYDLKWIEDLVYNLWSLVQMEDIEVRRDDQKLYTFKEGDFKRLHLQDIEDMLLLLVQQKLTNLTIDERYDLNVALRMYTRWIVIKRRVEDLQLGVKSYQKKLKLTKPDTFSDGTLDDVRSALNDITKGIRMEYLPMRKWSNLDKKRAWVMVQDIDKQLYQKRLMWNLKKFVGGREYGNDLRLLEKTI